MESEHRQEREIFDGKFKFVTDLSEFRMSLWVVSFGIIDNSNGETILDLKSYFHMDKNEIIGDILNLRFRIYPVGNVSYDVKINPFTRTFVYKNMTIALKDFYKTFDL